MEWEVPEELLGGEGHGRLHCELGGSAGSQEREVEKPSPGGVP